MKPHSKIEVELKCAIQEQGKVKKFLQGLECIETKRIVDTYLDAKDATLFQRGIFIRVRNAKKLDFKFNPAHFDRNQEEYTHDHCDELSYRLPLQQRKLDAINSVLQILGLKEISSADLIELRNLNKLLEFVTIDKQREIFTDGTFEYSFDHVKNLGAFLEIECHTSDVSKVNSIKARMLQKIQNLGLKVVEIGYVELYLRKNAFDLYTQGLYLLREDKRRLKDPS